MKVTKKPLALLAGSFLILAVPFVCQGAEVADMAKKCDDCHGKKGNSEDDKVPTIAGFSAVTIEDILVQYKAGDRPADKYKNSEGEEIDMQEVAKDLSDEDIKAISLHYSEQKFIPHTQKFDAAMAEKGAKIHDRKCEKCHSDGGTNPEDDAAILAGQWRAYLVRQFDLIKSKERDTPKKMKKKFKKLKDKDMKVLIEYYVSQQ